MFVLFLCNIVKENFFFSRKRFANTYLAKYPCIYKCCNLSLRSWIFLYTSSRSKCIERQSISIIHWFYFISSCYSRVLRLFITSSTECTMRTKHDDLAFLSVKRIAFSLFFGMSVSSVACNRIQCAWLQRARYSSYASRSMHYFARNSGIHLLDCGDCGEFFDDANTHPARVIRTQARNAFFD